MRVLGIDPGSNITGYGLIELAGNRIRHVDNGIIGSKKSQALPKRLRNIHLKLTELIEFHRPDIAVIENVFFAKNARSSLMLGHARGVAMLAASNANIEVAEYTPTEVKLAITGSGRGDKNQVQQMVKAILGLPEVAYEDASDALAIAICHCHTSGLKRRIEESQG